MPRRASADNSAKKRRTPTKRALATEPAPVGRPSVYRSEFDEQAFKLCLLGATDAQLADFFGVSVTTIDNWKTAHPGFLGALKAGKEEADARVAHSLFHRAIGYEHEAVKITTHAETGHTTVTPYVERYPPDTTAAIFWLKNRRRSEWRDRQEHEHSGTVTLASLLAAPPAPPAPPPDA